jgi:hypothetical protein
MEAVSLEQKALKVQTLLEVASKLNNVYFKDKEKKTVMIEDALNKLEAELKTF